MTVTGTLLDAVKGATALMDTEPRLRALVAEYLDGGIVIPAEGDRPAYLVPKSIIPPSAYATGTNFQAWFSGRVDALRGGLTTGDAYLLRLENGSGASQIYRLTNAEYPATSSLVPGVNYSDLATELATVRELDATAGGNTFPVRVANDSVTASTTAATAGSPAVNTVTGVVSAAGMGVLGLDAAGFLPGFPDPMNIDHWVLDETHPDYAAYNLDPDDEDLQATMLEQARLHPNFEHPDTGAGAGGNVNEDAAPDNSDLDLNDPDHWDARPQRYVAATAATPSVTTTPFIGHSGDVVGSVWELQDLLNAFDWAARQLRADLAGGAGAAGTPQVRIRNEYFRLATDNSIIARLQAVLDSASMAERANNPFMRAANITVGSAASGYFAEARYQELRPSNIHQLVGYELNVVGPTEPGGTATWATGGNMRSSNAYVQVRLGSYGDDGRYYYDPAVHGTLVQNAYIVIPLVIVPTGTGNITISDGTNQNRWAPQTLTNRGTTVGYNAAAATLVDGPVSASRGRIFLSDLRITFCKMAGSPSFLR